MTSKNIILSERDMICQLKLYKEEISTINKRTSVQTKIIDDASTKLAEAKKLVQELEAKLMNTQTSINNDKKRKKKLTEQVTTIENNLKIKSDSDKKSNYVKRCILYLLENGNDHIDKVDQHVYIDLSFLDDKYTEENLATLFDDDIIQLAHITRICQIFQNVKDEIEDPLLEWYYDDDDEYIYFSEKSGCFEGCSCHKRYAYVFFSNWSHIVSYTNTFSIDTSVKDAYCFTRIN